MIIRVIKKLSVEGMRHMLYGTQCSYLHAGKGQKVKAEAGAGGQFTMIVVVAIKN